MDDEMNFHIGHGKKKKKRLCIAIVLVSMGAALP